MSSTWNMLIPRLHALSRSYSTLNPPSLEAGIAKILHKSKEIPDHLSPTASHLLNLLFSDIFSTPQATPPQYPITAEHAAPLPQGHHLVYFPLQTRPAELMPDGTDPDHCPGAPFTRRLWAGGEVRFGVAWDDDMRLDGKRVKCVEKVEGVRPEKGRVWVDLWRSYGAWNSENVPAIEERRTLAFLPDIDTPASPRRSLKRKFSPLHEPTFSLTLKPTQNLLTNFSALTYNAHAIHLDPAWARQEGHPATLVHGPLSLALVLGYLNHLGQRVKWFGYRNLQPLYCGREMTLCVRDKGIVEEGKRWDVWIRDADGGMAVKGTATTVFA